MRSWTRPTRQSTGAPGVRSRSTERQHAENVGWIAFTEEEIRGLCNGRESLGDRYTVCLASLAATFPPKIHDTSARWIEGRE